MTAGSVDDLPKRVRQSGRNYYWRPSATLKDQGYRSIPLGSDREAALKRATEINDQIDPRQMRQRRIEAERDRRAKKMALAYEIAFSRAKRRASDTGRPFGLTVGEFRVIVERAGGLCELTAITFDLSRPERNRRAPFSPSLDRIDSRLGYNAANCRLVCCAVNIALQDFGDAVFRRICYAVVARDGARLITISENGTGTEVAKDFDFATY